MAKPNRVLVIATDHAQFADLSNALNGLRLVDPGSIIRITGHHNLRRYSNVRVIGLPGWSTRFCKPELALMKQVAKAQGISLYTLSVVKYQRLLVDADRARASIQEQRSLLLESSEGGDFPDS